MSTAPLPDVRRSIGFWSGVGLFVGTVIGGGIFRTPASIAGVLGDPTLILALWLGFGLVSLCGALTLAELATMLPKTGGVYVYLRAAYGDSAAFVFGWVYLFAAIPSGLAALAVFFGELMLGFFGVAPATSAWAIPILASGAIVLLSAANIAGVRWGTSIQNVFALLKVGALLALIGVGLTSGAADFGRWFAEPAQPDTLAGLAAATKSVMFTLNGWVYISLVAGEVVEPERRLARMIMTSMATILVLYLLANLAYLALIPLSAMPGTVVAREAMRVALGPTASVVMGACILASVFGAMNGVILAKARVAYALGRDGLIFSWLMEQPVRDTLCGTKVLFRSDYLRIAANRSYFGEFDPFGDFDLIFGAVKLNLKVVEIPVRYLARSYGETQISRFRHGWLLLQMVAFAWRKLKAY